MLKIVNSKEVTKYILHIDGQTNALYVIAISNSY